MAVAYLRRLLADFPAQLPGSGQVAFVVHNVALGQVFSEY
jgi:hypothetical protein